LHDHKQQILNALARLRAGGYHRHRVAQHSVVKVAEEFTMWLMLQYALLLLLQGSNAN
jgi:hypothetical protein